MAEQDSSVARYILSHDPAETIVPKSYFQAYRTLAEFVFSSLDLYKPELRTVLFPLYVHCYLSLLQREFSNEGLGGPLVMGFSL